jgi:hypothetical protein
MTLPISLVGIDEFLCYGIQQDDDKSTCVRFHMRLKNGTMEIFDKNNAVFTCAGVSLSMYFAKMKR